MSTPSAAPQLSGAVNGPNARADEAAASVHDDVLYEVVDGRVVEKTAGAFELEIAAILHQHLGMFVSARRIGRAVIEMTFRIDQTRDLQRRPDVAFVSHARWPVGRRAPDVTVWDIAPDLAVEVVSKTNAADDVQQKTHDYFKAGVTRVWVIYPRQQEVYVYSSPTEVQILQLGQELDGGDLIPGFRLPLAALFQDESEE
jgi:Uma2 family endonuclease